MAIRGLCLAAGLFACAAATFSASPSPAADRPVVDRLPHDRPATVGMNTDQTRRDRTARWTKHYRPHKMPGCVVLIARRGKVVFLKAYGHRQIEPERVAMTTDTVFDLASLTKPIATATSVMPTGAGREAPARRSGSQTLSRIRPKRQGACDHLRTLDASGRADARQCVAGLRGRSRTGVGNGSAL